MLENMTLCTFYICILFYIFGYKFLPSLHLACHGCCFLRSYELDSLNIFIRDCNFCIYRDVIIRKMKRVFHVSNWKRLYNMLHGVERSFFLFWNAVIDSVLQGILLLFWDQNFTCLLQVCAVHQ